MHNTKERGRKGEQAAEKLLKSKGFTIITKNFFCRYGEIDIIAEKDGRISFIEVKSRSNTDFAAPREFVTKEKQRKIVNTACIYLKQNNVKKPLRFDVIEVIFDKEFKQVLSINHLENAFST